MKALFLSPLLLLGSLWGTFSEPARIEYATGYRNDRLHWHLQDPGDGGALNYSEVYRDLQFWENALSLTVYHRDIYFFLGGDYSAFGQGGRVNQRYANLSFTTDEPHFAFTPQGWATDGICHFGYCVNLTNGRTYKTILIPFVGVSLHYEQLERKEGRPSSRISDNAIGADSYEMSSWLPGRLNLFWYGFLLGGAFHIDSGGRLLFDVGYNYSWLHVRFHTHFSNQVLMGSPLFTDQTTENAIKSKTSGNLGHTGWAKVSYRINGHWRAGLGASVYYFASRNFNSKDAVQISGEPSSKIDEKTKIRWTSISGLAHLSRDF